MTIAESVARTKQLERDRAVCLELLETLHARERAQRGRREEGERALAARERQVEAREQRVDALSAEIADFEAAQGVARAEIRSLSRQLARLAEQERASEQELARLDTRTESACSAAAAARDRVLCASYRLTQDEVGRVT